MLTRAECNGLGGNGLIRRKHTARRYCKLSYAATVLIIAPQFTAASTPTIKANATISAQFLHSTHNASDVAVNLDITSPHTGRLHTKNAMAESSATLPTNNPVPSTILDGTSPGSARSRRMDLLLTVVVVLIGCCFTVRRHNHQSRSNATQQTNFHP